MAPLTDNQLDNIQGDIWSKGFPKYYETYHFFSIKLSKEKIFAQCLKTLATLTSSPPLISTLRKVRADQDLISQRKEEARAEARRQGKPEKDVQIPIIPVSNALIAFTSKGLIAIQAGLSEARSLGLEFVQQTDPAFSNGMASDSSLSDPDPKTWDALLQSTKIHGMLKIGGSSKDKVEEHLNKILAVLKHGTAIEDAFKNSPSTPTDSRVDGWTRPNDRGKEHFGFEDGISQPRMDGIDKLELERDSNGNAVVNMNTDPKILIVPRDTSSEKTSVKRPEWMVDGSFLFFRKLEQDVKAFEDLTDKWPAKNCESKEHMGAKLMGRWQSGAPLANPQFRKKDSKNLEAAKLMNDFTYADEVCPVSAHIRKTNPRVNQTRQTRIIRNGIPYGSDYKGDPNDKSKRGLLFACYQGHIEDGFQFMQQKWSNNSRFGNFENKTRPDPGLDPIIGQTKVGNGELETFFTDKSDVIQSVKFEPLVTLKGGEYFFVPSISALSGELAKT